MKGIAYTILSLWWGFVTAVKLAREQRLGKSKFRGSTIQPCFYCPAKQLRVLPIESFVKLFGLSFHVYMEWAGGFNHIHEDPNDHSWHLEYENAHHICMIIGFLIGALVEVLIYCGLPLPKRAAYIFNFIAFLIQFVVMTGHLEGDHSVEFTAHRMWTILITFSLLSGLAETVLPDNAWIVYARILSFLSQGTWLMQIAFVVWPHNNNPHFQWKEDHATHAWLTILGMTHLMICSVVLTIQYLSVYLTIRFWDRLYSKYEIDAGLDKPEPIKKLNFAKFDKDYASDGSRGFANNSKEYASLINEEE
jgi:hypothetical protein